MRKLWQELKISNLFLRGSIGLKGKRNDERMISQTPTVHKFDEVSSRCLADCLKYVRESQWRRVNMVSHVARKSRERKTGQVCPARKACVEESERMLPHLFIVARGSDPDRMAWNILIGRKYEVRTKTVKIFLCQTIIWNSFCFSRIFDKLSLSIKIKMEKKKRTFLLSEILKLQRLF